ncbi:MAG: hypothetical protein IPK71_14555 [Myxococcales bacterium]|nr:hypothetical protein [Myxococcales bacterium]
MPSSLPALPLPKLSLDGKQRAVLVAGRTFEVSGLPYAKASKLVRTCAELSEKHGLPLGVVWAEAPEKGEEIYGDCVAGIVLFHAVHKANKKTGEATDYAIEADLLSLKSEADVPEDFWAALTAAGVGVKRTSEDDDDDESDPEEAKLFGPTKDGTRDGVFLAPSGYAVATLVIGDAELTCSSDDTVPHARITPEVRALAAKAKKVAVRPDYA